jgi:predicted dehydrogenase
MEGFFRVHGSKGVIHMEPAFGYQGLHLKAEIAGQAPIDDANTQKDPYQFVIEGDYFADCIRENKEPKTDGEEGLRDIQLIAQIYKSCGLKLG